MKVRHQIRNIVVKFAYAVFRVGAVYSEKPYRVGEVCLERWYLAALSGSPIQAPGFAGGTVTVIIHQDKCFIVAARAGPVETS